MRKRKSVRGLVLAAINVVVILAAALVVQSLAAGDFVPTSSLAVLPDESEFTLASLDDRTPFPFRGASGPLASPSSAKGRDASTEIVAAAANGRQDALPSGALEFDEQWYAEPLAAFASSATASESFPLKASASGYGSALSTASFGRRSGLSTGYAGMGGGFSGAGGASNPLSSQSSPVSSAGLRSSSSGPTASVAGAPLLPPQAQGNPFSQAQGNPLSGGGNPVFGLTLTLAQSPGLGAGGAAVLNQGGSGASVTQLQEPVSVPEPSTVLLLGCGLALAAYRNRRRLPLRS